LRGVDEPLFDELQNRRSPGMAGASQRHGQSALP
jgi:hypothetical protein